MLGQRHSTSALGRHSRRVSLARALFSSQRISPKKILESSTSTGTPVDQKRARERGIIFVGAFCSSLSEPASFSTPLPGEPQTTENSGYHRRHVIHTCDRLGR